MEIVPGPSSNAIAELTKKLGVYGAFGMPDHPEGYFYVKGYYFKELTFALYIQFHISMI